MLVERTLANTALFGGIQSKIKSCFELVITYITIPTNLLEKRTTPGFEHN